MDPGILHLRFSPSGHFVPAPLPSKLVPDEELERHYTRPMGSETSRHGQLEMVISQLEESYGGPEEINNLESAELPNSRKVIEALRHLQALTFLGFYSTRSLSPANLRFALSEHLYPTYEILSDQIERARRYRKRCGRALGVDDSWSERVVMDLLQQLPRLRRLLNADVRAAFEGDPAAASIEEVVFSYPSIAALTAHRIAHVLYNHNVPMVPRIISEHAHAKTGIDIHPGARLGKSLFIDHGTGVVIGETAVIGEGVKIYQGVTLGALSTSRESEDEKCRVQRHPTIEDDVTIYAHATILGGETVIGQGSTVGGNVWLVKSVPPRTKIFGRPRSVPPPDPAAV